MRRRLGAGALVLLGVLTACSAEVPGSSVTPTQSSASLSASATATVTSQQTPSSTPPAPVVPARPSVVSNTKPGAPGGTVGLVLANGVLWGLDDSGAGQPGYLLRATTAHPHLVRVAKIGTYASGLAVTNDRVWVVNGSGDPRDHAYKDSTIDEFDTSARLLREYKVPGAASITARGHDAWVNIPQSAPPVTAGLGSTAIDALSAGRVRHLTNIAWTVAAQAPTIGLLPDGRLVTLTSGSGDTTSVWFLDPSTGRHLATTTVELSGLASLAVRGNDVLVAVGSVTTGGVADVTATTARVLPHCGNPDSVAASVSSQWALSTVAQGAVAVSRVTSAGCGPLLTLGGAGGTAQIAADGPTAWILSVASLTRVH